MGLGSEVFGQDNLLIGISIYDKTEIRMKSPHSGLYFFLLFQKNDTDCLFGQSVSDQFNLNKSDTKVALTYPTTLRWKAYWFHPAGYGPRRSSLCYSFLPNQGSQNG